MVTTLIKGRNNNFIDPVMEEVEVILALSAEDEEKETITRKEIISIAFIVESLGTNQLQIAYSNFKIIKRKMLQKTICFGYFHFYGLKYLSRKELVSGLFVVNILHSW